MQYKKAHPDFGKKIPTPPNYQHLTCTYRVKKERGGQNHRKVPRQNPSDLRKVRHLQATRNRQDQVSYLLYKQKEEKKMTHANYNLLKYYNYRA
jgi:hypothetical protein